MQMLKGMIMICLNWATATSKIKDYRREWTFLYQPFPGQIKKIVYIQVLLHRKYPSSKWTNIN